VVPEGGSAPLEPPPVIEASVPADTVVPEGGPVPGEVALPAEAPAQVETFLPVEEMLQKKSGPRCKTASKVGVGTDESDGKSVP